MSTILNILNTRKERPTFITGDFNLDLLKSDTHVLTGEFLNHLTSHSFLPTIHKPIRITDTSATLIENIFINTILFRFEAAIVYSDISDHYPIIIRLDFKIQKQNVVPLKRQKYDTECVIKFKNALGRINWM